MGSLPRGRLLRSASFCRNFIQIPRPFMHFGDNIPLTKKVYLVMNEKRGGVFDKETRPIQGGQAGISPSVFLYLT
jgi:hypothetical protein